MKSGTNQELYAVDGDAGFNEPSNEVLLKMGKYMEKMLKEITILNQNLLKLKKIYTAQDNTSIFNSK